MRCIAQRRRVSWNWAIPSRSDSSWHCVMCDHLPGIWVLQNQSWAFDACGAMPLLSTAKLSTVFVFCACQCSQVGKQAGCIQKSMGKDRVNQKKRARTDSIGLAGKFTPKKKQVEQQMRVEGESLFHGHKLLVHNPKQCVTIAVWLDEKTLRKALRK